MENRNGLSVGGVLTRAAGGAEPLAAPHLAEALPPGPKTLAADKANDSHNFVTDLRALGITPHVAQNAYAAAGRATRRSAIDRRTTRHPGYALSQQKRERIEEILGWLKSVRGCRQTRFRGLERVRHGVHRGARRLQSDPHPQALGAGGMRPSGKVGNAITPTSAAAAPGRSAPASSTGRYQNHVATDAARHQGLDVPWGARDDRGSARASARNEQDGATFSDSANVPGWKK